VSISAGPPSFGREYLDPLEQLKGRRRGEEASISDEGGSEGGAHTGSTNGESIIAGDK
jgi:hypothetical protein